MEKIEEVEGSILKVGDPLGFAEPEYILKARQAVLHAEADMLLAQAEAYRADARRTNAEAAHIEAENNMGAYRTTE